MLHESEDFEQDYDASSNAIFEKDKMMLASRRVLSMRLSDDTFA